MEQSIVSRKISQDPLARRLLTSIEGSQKDIFLSDGYIYYDYPIYEDLESDLFKPTFLLLSDLLGIVLLKCMSSHDQNDIQHADEHLEQINSLLISKLLKSKILRKSASALSVPVRAFLYIESLGSTDSYQTNNVIVTAFSSLKSHLKEPISETLPEASVQEIRAIIEGTKALQGRNKRYVPDTEQKSKRAILAKLEAEVANFDEDQRKAAISLIQGPQRIRGLAGSGKTIVLAMKAAHIHLTEPDAKILFTFNTKSLYDIIKSLITRFYRQFADRDPNWENLNILHGWGGRSVPGVYFNACQENNYMPKDWKSAPKNTKSALDWVCGDLLQKRKLAPKYDYVLIDEAQDFESNFFKLCLQITKGTKDQRNIVWAYDELQSIFTVLTRTPLELFGTDINNDAEIDLERAAKSLDLPQYMSNDVVLHKCYRNAREVLICAHAIGFALYADIPVQMLQDKNHWQDIGYEITSGDFQVGSDITIFRPEKNSPLSVSKLQMPSELIVSKVAENMREEVDWAVEQIMMFLSEGLAPDDILLICLDDRHVQSYFSKIEAGLDHHDIELSWAGKSRYGDTRFRIEGQITACTVYQAKGNEAPAVIIVGLDALWQDRELRIGRNKLFTALTRSKAWVCISGLGEQAKFFINEIETALENVPYLFFKYPDPKAVETLQRDLTTRGSKVKTLLSQLENLGITADEVAEHFGASEKKID